MAISRVQIMGSVPPGGTIGSAVFSSQPTAGNLVIAAFTTYGGTIPLTSVGDSAGNTYTRRSWGSTTGPMFTAIYSAENITTGANFTVFGTESGAHGVVAVIAEYAGALTSNPFDTSGSKTTSGTIVNSGTTAALATATEMAFAVCTHDGANLTITENTAGGWTLGTKLQDGNSYQPVSAVDNIVNSTTALSETWTLSASQHWVGAIATFKSATTGSTGSMTGSFSFAGNLKIG